MSMDELFPVLLVEDNKHDVVFVQRAWRQHNIANPLYVVPHGQACLDFLVHEGDYRDSNLPLPGLILMDVRMPVMDGITCISHIRERPNLRAIPIVVLTTSKQDEDRVRSYHSGANTFIQKPVDFAKFSEAVKTIHGYWSLSIAP